MAARPETQSPRGGLAAGEFPRLFMSLLSVVMWVPAPLPRLLLDDLWDL